jgi:hypothetical protein
LAAAAVFVVITLRRASPDIGKLTQHALKCAECGHVVEYVPAVGDNFPMTCKECGKQTAWIAEACFWTKDGKAKRDPTWVLVKKQMGLEGRTYCPDCGKEVVGHNPRPPKELMAAAQAGS